MNVEGPREESRSLWKSGADNYAIKKWQKNRQTIQTLSRSLVLSANL